MKVSAIGKKDLSKFDKIAASGSVDIYFSYGKEYTIDFGDNNSLEYVKVRQENGTLFLGTKDIPSNNHNMKLKVYVTAPEINSLALSGGTDFKADELKIESEFNFAFSGGSDCNIKYIKANVLSIAANGGSDVEIDRVDANQCNFAFSGGSDFKIENLKAEDLNIAARGGSDISIKCEVRNAIAVAAEGSSDIKLNGNTKTISLSTSESADVDIKGLTYETINSQKGKNRDRNRDNDRDENRNNRHKRHKHRD